MHCPRCKTVLNSINLKDIQIDICPMCYGVWLDKEELQKLLEIDRNTLKLIENKEEIDGNWLKLMEIDSKESAKEENLSRIAEGYGDRMWEGEIGCPKCNTMMQKHPYAVTSDIFIDSCPNGCGIWLDKGEILRIADYLTTAEKPLTDIQKEQVKQRLRMFAEANKEKVSPLQFLNKRYFSETELEKDLNTTSEGKYVSIIRMVIQGLLYFLLRRGRF